MNTDTRLDTLEKSIQNLYENLNPMLPGGKRELRIIRLKGPVKWWRGLWAVRRFHRAVDEMRAAEGGHDA